MPLGATPSAAVLAFKNLRQSHIRLTGTFLKIEPDPRGRMRLTPGH